MWMLAGGTDPDREALPQPFLGDLTRRPTAAVSSLYPGPALVGRRGGREDDTEGARDIHGRDGFWARQIRDRRGSYTQWAWHWGNSDDVARVDLDADFATARQLIDHWHECPVTPDELLRFELYPWHASQLP